MKIIQRKNFQKNQIFWQKFFIYDTTVCEGVKKQKYKNLIQEEKFMLNRVVLVGRLSRDPELRKTNSDASVVAFTVAVDNRTKDANGNKTTSFVPCVCWNAVADSVYKFTKKGVLVGVEGRINQRSYKKADGTNVYIMEVVADTVQFLSPKNTNGSGNENGALIEGGETIDITEDDLPF
jgi:single-strand DNA-binding protein